MTKETKSRFITYPSTEPKSDNHTVLLIDEDPEKFGDLIEFFQTCPVDFDVYLYRHDDYDLEWLNYVHGYMDKTLINNTSGVSIQNGEHDRYGPDMKYQSVLEYFEKFSTEMVDI
jgi:hypothetical protein